MTATATQPASIPERRYAPRRQPAQGATCHLASGTGKDLGLGLVWNISTSGVSMLLAAPIEPGTEVKGEFLAGDGRTTLGLTLRVAHLRPLRTGDYILGGQFQRELTSQELQPFLGEAA